MCGIFFCYCCSTSDPSNDKNDKGNILEIEPSNLKVVQELLNDSALTHRGPDVSRQYKLPLSSAGVNGWMRGCVLHLRGRLTPQPLVDDKGNALLWNGEIFDGIEVSRDENDTQVLFQRLTSCTTDEEVLHTLEGVRGPWAVIFWQAEKKKLWFGRDVYGRRSLLWHLPTHPSDLLVITSVSVGSMDYTEIPSVGIFTLDLSATVNKNECDSSAIASGMHTPPPAPPAAASNLLLGPSITLHPWYHCRWPGTTRAVLETPPDELSSYLLSPNPSSSSSPSPSSVIPISVDTRQILKHWLPTMCKALSSSGNNHDDDGSLFLGDEKLKQGNDDGAAVLKGDDSLKLKHSKNDVAAVLKGDEILKLKHSKDDGAVLLQVNERLKHNNDDENVENDLVSSLEKIGRENESLRLLSTELVDVLQKAVMKRVDCLPVEEEFSPSSSDDATDAKIAVLFSGGLDSSVLAALLDRCLPLDEPIDLLNVAFEQPTPTRNTANSKQKRNKQRKKKPIVHQDRQENAAKDASDNVSSGSFLNSDEVPEEKNRIHKRTCVTSFHQENDSNSTLDSHLSASNSNNCGSGDKFNAAPVLTSLSDSNTVPSNNCGGGDDNENAFSSSTSLLDSHTVTSNKFDDGGDNKLYASASALSSTSLFEDIFYSKCNANDTSSSISSSQNSQTQNIPNIDFDPYDVPDRRTGRIAFSELNPKRRWNFIEINVSQEELQTLRSSRIRKLIYPLHTVLDDSIGCAVWFASRGRGTLVSGDQTQHHTVTSQAKVILCGMAADEQFAGYSRHRAHFHKLGEQSLVDQLELEMARISSRNLGRDDRIIADHGKEARFPFLDEAFTDFVSKIPVYLRANLHLPRGLGEKLLLRLSGWSLGLRLTACQPKRAIQFGSKIAKLDNSKEKGSDICNRLL